MNKSILLLAAASLTCTTLYAKDIRYVYCKAEFAPATITTPNHKIDRDEQFILFSPIFKIDIHDKAKYSSTIDFVNQFISAVYSDAKKGKAHAYLYPTDAARAEGCNVENTNLDDAKKSYDRDYLKEWTFVQPHSGKRCGYIGTYNWKPISFETVYPNKVSPYSSNAYAQSCKYDTPARYKD